MTPTRDELLLHYRNMRADLLAAVDELSDVQMSDPTLDGWAVKDHLLHLALWDTLRAEEVNRISAGFESLWRMDQRQQDAFGPVAFEMRRDIPAPQAKWELDQTHERLLDAIANATERGLDGSLYGEAGLMSRHEAAHTHWIRRWRDERGV